VNLFDNDPHIDRWEAMREVDAKTFAEIRCRMLLDGCKWDAQVGDVATLASFPLILPARVAFSIGRLAEDLAAEALSAEKALVQRPDCLRLLGLPGAVRRQLGAAAAPTPAAARVIRFDFHPTAEGWRISEANADVPGGYTESSLFPRLMAEHFPGARPVGDPAGALIQAVLSAMGRQGTVALLAATGHMEDQQVIAFLASLLEARGCAVMRAHPAQITWDGGVALLADAQGKVQPLDALIRFYQGEWLARWPPRVGWGRWFRGGRTPVCNPGTALVVESKRFPLTWDRLGLELPTWRRLLPVTVAPRRLRWRFGSDWVLKTAYCNTGDTVTFADDPRHFPRRTAWSARLWPGSWVAQRRFETLAVSTPRGAMVPCLGVYTVNGKAAGIFGRLAKRPPIDFASTEVAVLVEKESDER
jgi:glutathionylspermidine synthase